MQTDLGDIFKGLVVFNHSPNSDNLFVKGLRHGRPISDVFFTMGMSIFETLLLRKPMWDINFQPTMFTRQFFMTWNNPPNDFSLDLFAYYMVLKSGLEVQRFPVVFSKRAYGVSKWNVNISSKYRFIKRTLVFSFELRRRLK